MERLSKEEELIILCSTISPTEEVVKRIKKIISYDMKWDKFLYLAVHHRVVSLVVKVLSKLELLGYIENHVRRVLCSTTTAITYNNRMVFKELSNILQAFEKENIKVVVLKGLGLVDSVYNELSLRQFGDIDLLIDKKDLNAACKLLVNYGYIQGKIDVNTNSVIPATRKEIVSQRVNTHEIIEFIKTNQDELCPYFMIDINFLVSWKWHPNIEAITKEFMGSTYKQKSKHLLLPMNLLLPEYQLIHLCLHLYSEAVYFYRHSNWIRDKSDLNLVKFCDIRELIIQQHINWETVNKIAQKHDITEAVMYSLFLTNELFPNTIPEKIFEDSKVNKAICNSYFDEADCVQYWSLSFFERMFNIEGKKDEIKLIDSTKTGAML